jgi:hypothetical protein
MLARRGKLGSPMLHIASTLLKFLLLWFLLKRANVYASHFSLVYNLLEAWYVQPHWGNSWEQMSKSCDSTGELLLQCIFLPFMSWAQVECPKMSSSHFGFSYMVETGNRYNYSRCSPRRCGWHRSRSTWCAWALWRWSCQTCRRSLKTQQHQSGSGFSLISFNFCVQEIGGDNCS